MVEVRKQRGVDEEAHTPALAPAVVVVLVLVRSVS